MTTPLRKPLSRELLLGEVPFTVVLSRDGLRIMQKGKRKGPLVSWETILRLGEVGHHEAHAPSVTGTELPDSVAAEVAKEILAAKSALTRAGEQIAAGRDLPPELRSRMDPDPVYGAQEQRTDWIIEPLLTPAEVASILRLSVSAVSRLPIPWIDLAGERRYRQSEVRRYLEGQARIASRRAGGEGCGFSRFPGDG